MPTDKQTPQGPPEKRKEQEWGGPRQPPKGPTKKAVIEDLNWITDRLSGQARTVALGVLALAWGLLVSESATAQVISGVNRPQLILIGLLAVVVMFCDFMQYVSGYQNTIRLYRTMQEQGLEQASYPEDIFYLGRKFFFAAKQWLTAVSVLWLGILLLRAIA